MSMKEDFEALADMREYKRRAREALRKIAEEMVKAGVIVQTHEGDKGSVVGNARHLAHSAAGHFQNILSKAKKWGHPPQ